jgi:predicted DNA-binding protein (MmcQ/YjbR family)
MATKKTAKKKAPAKKTPAKKAPAKKTPNKTPKKAETHPKRAQAAAEVAKLPPLDAKVAKELARRRAELKQYALSLPEAYEDHPWGESVAKVNKKVFLFMGHEGEDGMSYDVLGFGVKLPVSGDDALELPFTEPMGYGLGKSGWVVVRFPANEEPPMEELRRWIDESYRAVAPKKLAALLPQR